MILTVADLKRHLEYFNDDELVGLISEHGFFQGFEYVHREKAPLDIAQTPFVCLRLSPEVVYDTESLLEDEECDT